MYMHSIVLPITNVFITNYEQFIYVISLANCVMLLHAIVVTIITIIQVVNISNFCVHTRFNLSLMSIYRVLGVCYKDQG